MIDTNRNFLIYFFIIVLSLAGINLFIYTQSWYVMEISSSKLSVGLAWSIFFTPGLFLLPILGKVLDHYNLNKMLSFFDYSRAIILLIFIPILKMTESVYTVYILSAFIGFLFASFYPSIYVVLKRVIPEEKLAKFSHLIELAIQISSATSIIFAGYLYESIGFIKLMLVAVCLLLVSGFLYRYMHIPNDNEIEPLEIKVLFKNSFMNLIYTIKKFFDNSLDKYERNSYLFGLVHLFPQALIMSMNILIVLYVYEVMIKGPVEYGFLDSCIGFAAILASGVWAKYNKLSTNKNMIIVMLIFSMILFISIGILPANTLLPYGLFFLLGFFITSVKMQNRAAVLKITSNNIIGELVSIYQIINYIVTLTLAFIFSYLLQFYNVRELFIFLGVFILFYTIIIWCVYTPNRNYNGDDLL